MKTWTLLLVLLGMLPLTGAADFSVNVPVIKVTYTQEDIRNFPLTVINLEKSQEFNVEIESGEEFIRTDKEKFSLDAGGAEELVVSFPEDLIPGVYLGRILIEGKNDKLKIPVILEVESENLLFDVSTEPVLLYKRIIPGEEFIVNIDVLSLEFNRTNVFLEYYVTDFDNGVITSRYQNLTVRDEVKQVLSFSIPEDTDPGDYVFYAISKAEDSVGSSTLLFVVSPLVSEAEGIPLFFYPFYLHLVLILAFFSLALLLFLNFYWYKRISFVKKRIERKLEEAKKISKKQTMRKDEISQSLRRAIIKRIKDLQSRKVLLKNAYDHGKINSQTYNSLFRKIDLAIDKLQKRL